MSAEPAKISPSLEELTETFKAFKADPKAYAPIRDDRVLNELIDIFTKNPLVRPVYGPCLAAELERRRRAERKKVAELKKIADELESKRIAEIERRTIAEIDRQRILSYGRPQFGFSAVAGVELTYRVELLKDRSIELRKLP
jgi:hypothetical protein